MDMHIISFLTKFNVPSVINNLKIKSKFRVLIITVFVLHKNATYFLCVYYKHVLPSRSHHSGADGTDSTVSSSATYTARPKQFLEEDPELTELWQDSNLPSSSS
jgi:hypothetical protein